jgi:hypothetical protein
VIVRYRSSVLVGKLLILVNLIRFANIKRVEGYEINIKGLVKARRTLLRQSGSRMTIYYMNVKVISKRVKIASNVLVVPNHTPTYTFAAGQGEKHVFSNPPFTYLDLLVPRALHLIP